MVLLHSHVCITIHYTVKWNHAYKTQAGSALQREGEKKRSEKEKKKKEGWAATSGDAKMVEKVCVLPKTASVTSPSIPLPALRLLQSGDGGVAPCPCGFTQQLGQQVGQRFEGRLVALPAQVQEVEHVMMTDAAVQPYQPGVQVH